MKITQEKRWVFLFALAVLVVTSLPYLFGYANQGSQWRFTGFVFGVEDGNSYIAKMLRGANGDWLFRTPYTSFQQRGFLAFFPYLLLGKLTSPPGQHEQLVALYQFYRWIAGFLCIAATYDFVSLFIRQIRMRRMSLVLITLGGGLGWLSVLGLQNLWQNGVPLEFYSPESFTFLSIFGLPHLALGRAFLMWGLAAYLKPGAGGSGSLRWGLSAGLWWLGLGLVQPLVIVIGWTVTAGHLCGLYLWEHFSGSRPVHQSPVWRGYVLRGLGMVIVSSPPVLYNSLVFRIDSFLSRWFAQNVLISPPFLDYLLAYGVLLVFAGTAVVFLYRERSLRRVLLLVGWLLLLPLLVYAPLNVQRRMAEGVWVAFVILAVIGAERVRRTRLKYSTYLLYASLITYVLFFVGAFQVISTPAAPLYRSAAQVAVFNYLGANAAPGAVVLANHDISNALPAWTPQRTVTGHGPESVDLPRVSADLERFFSADLAPEARQEILQAYGIDYVLVGPEDGAVGAWYSPGGQDLQMVFNSGGYSLYACRRE